MKKIYFLLIALLLNVSIYAQITFENTYDFSTGDDATDVLELDGGGYLVCGNVFDDTNGDYDVFVAKFDANGNETWSEIYVGVGVEDDFAEKITETSDGNFIICGSTTDETNGDTEAFLLKINSAGTEIFNKTYGVVGDDDIFYYITELEGGGLAAVGSSTEGTEGFTDGWLAFIDDDGTFVDEFFYGLNGNDELNVIIETTDGGFIMVGNSYDEANGDIDGMLIKVNENADQQWIVYSNTTADELFNDLIILENGDYLIVGAEEDVTNGDLDMALTRISSNGSTELYSYTFDYDGDDDNAYSVYVDKNDDVFIGGYVTNFDAGDTDAYLVLIDPATGDILGEVIYGDAYDEHFNNFSFTSDNGFICAGSQEDDNGDSDVYLVKANEEGEVTTRIDKIENIAMTISPNPAVDYINIHANTTDALNFTLTDVSGKIIEKKALTTNQIDVSNLNSGIYFLNIESKTSKNMFKFIKK